MTPPSANNDTLSTWQSISVVGSWVIAVVGSFLLPLPEWTTGGENKSFTQFIYFIATVMAGFMLIYTFVNKNKKTWLFISVISFIILIALFFTYSYKRENLTLKHASKDVVIGTVHQPDYEAKLQAVEKFKRHKIDPKKILDYTGGDPTLIWTQESIDSSRWTLILLLLFCYTASSIFLLSFVNAFFLFKKESSA